MTSRVMVVAQKLYEVHFKIEDSTLPNKKITAELFEKHVGKDPTSKGMANRVFMQLNGTLVTLNSDSNVFSSETVTEYLLQIEKTSLEKLRIDGNDVYIL